MAPSFGETLQRQDIVGKRLNKQVPFVLISKLTEKRYLNAVGVYMKRGHFRTVETEKTLINIAIYVTCLVFFIEDCVYEIIYL